ncbi:carbohydrate kinase family protein [Pseudaeromonas sharmana]|uniref:Carbohydrate kinase family protein n=1 Tax=Pseudaeromonas sharmana TaxID=328412 RepID=A0ABV8CQH1_9GAMM
MSRLFISGLTNIETTLAIPQFPLAYSPVHYPFHGIHSTVSGVGINLALALHQLGHQVSLHTLTGADLAGEHVIATLQAAGLSVDGIHASLSATAQSVILYDPEGRRQIHVDLKECQQQSLPERAAAALRHAELALLCNINFSRPLLSEAKRYCVPVACDVHVLWNVDDDYNRDFMAQADILFCSDEGLNGREPADMLRELASRYGNALLVMGCGSRGALLYERASGTFHHAQAHVPRGIHSTVGAGDALFSAFIDGWLRHRDPRRALDEATWFAGWKIGAIGAAEGFPTREQWQALSGM